MAYFAPYIDESGLHVPTYQDILDFYVAGAKGIFGQDIYLDNDSPDYQMLSIQAVIANDAMQALILDYNNRSPKTAIGAALDSLVKINGIKRKNASYSTATLNLTGVAGITITDRICTDVNGYQWLLPASVTFDNSGNATVLATCNTDGAIAAQPNTIVNIANPIYGWFTVTNPYFANVGYSYEKDSKLRSRQSKSTKLSSENLLDGTKGAIEAIETVTRSKVYDNDSNVFDVNGIPPKSLAAVVEGGNDYDVAFVIYSNKGPGCNTYGTTSVNIISLKDNSSNTIRFFRPTITNIFVKLDIHIFPNWNDSYSSLISEAINNYIESLSIGQTVTLIPGISSAISSVVPDLANPPFSISSIKIGLAANSVAASDIPISFNSVAFSNSISINFV